MDEADMDDADIDGVDIDGVDIDGVGGGSSIVGIVEMSSSGGTATSEGELCPALRRWALRNGTVALNRSSLADPLLNISALFFIAMLPRPSFRARASAGWPSSWGAF
jgi:hypothetical protein